jgi:hypothetical protein
VSVSLCTKCGRGLGLHHLFGHLAYCTSERSPESRGTFTIREVNDMHRTLGHPIGQQALDLERREAEEAKR